MFLIQSYKGVRANDIIKGEKMDFLGYCHYKYHNQEVDWDMFEWKGCWTCWQYFKSYDGWMTVREAAEKYNVSQKTIYRWIKNGKLDATKAIMGRRNSDFPKQIWVIWESKTKIKRRKR